MAEEFFPRRWKEDLLRGLQRLRSGAALTAHHSLTGIERIRLNRRLERVHRQIDQACLSLGKQARAHFDETCRMTDEERDRACHSIDLLREQAQKVMAQIHDLETPAGFATLTGFATPEGFATPAEETAFPSALLPTEKSSQEDAPWRTRDPVAVITLGTNTFRLLVAQMGEDGRINPIWSEQASPRLGAGFSKECLLQTDAILRGVAVLLNFRRTLSEYPVDALSVVATSAVREAINQSEFLATVTRETGFNVTVLSGEEEARLTFIGVASLLPKTGDPWVVIDIGGGSTEMIFAHEDRVQALVSLPIGGVHLTEQYLHSDPPTPSEITAAKEAIHKTLRATAPPFPTACRFVGCAGTLTTLAAMDQRLATYQPDKINGYPLSKGSVEKWLTQLLAMTSSERSTLPGLEKGREEILIAGGLILLTVMEEFGYDPVVASDYGLREGVLIDQYRSQKETPSKNL